MKKLLIVFLLFSGSCLFYACNGNNTSSESSTSDSTSTTATDTLGTRTETMTNTTGTAMVDEKAKDFAADAATGGMMEVELGNLAQQEASSQAVKNFGKMMVDDHKKDIAAFKKAEGDVSDNDLKNFITNTLPTLQKHLDAIQAIKAKM